MQIIGWLMVAMQVVDSNLQTYMLALVILMICQFTMVVDICVVDLSRSLIIGVFFLHNIPHYSRDTYIICQFAIVIDMLISLYILYW